MCGLVGILGKLSNATEEIQRMLDTIRHRGPDDTGIWHDDNSGIYLGHQRLAIVDLSDAGKQPMHSPSSRFVHSCLPQ